MSLAFGLIAAAATLPFVTYPPSAVSSPIELIQSRHIGSNVNLTTGANICAVTSGEECRNGVPSKEAGGFTFLSSVAVDMRSGNVYVADTVNNRIQELTAEGRFVAMFGRMVNGSGASRSKGSLQDHDVCTAARADTCRAGFPGTSAGQFEIPLSVTVDPSDGSVYVLERGPGDFRIDRYTADGRFVWTVGKRVNGLTGGDLCTAREAGRAGAGCRGGEQGGGTIAPRAFKFARFDGDLLAAGGPQDLLYVGDEYRVQELDSSGRWRGQILLTSLSAAPGSAVAALAVDRAGNLYVVYHAPARQVGGGGEAFEEDTEAGPDEIQEFAPSGARMGEIPVYPRRIGAIVDLNGLAVDPSGRLLAVVGEEIDGGSDVHFGALYDRATGLRISDFAVPSDNDGIALGANDDLYIAATDDQEVVGYIPAPSVGLLTNPTPCRLAGAEDRINAFDCAIDL